MKIKWDILQRSLRGALNREENKVLDKWLSENKRHREAYRMISDFYASGPTPIKMSQDQVRQDFEEWRSKVQRPEKRRIPLRGMYVAAASVALFVVLSITLNYLNPPTNDFSQIVSGSAKAELILATGEVVALDTLQNRNISGMTITNDPVTGRVQYASAGTAEPDAGMLNTLIVPKGGIYTLELPDGTEVWVNSASTLHFPARFAANLREVVLTGEAFFKVARNNNAPFIVHAGERSVHVRGTSFNISAYQEDMVWRTTLVEGRVMIVGEKSETEMFPSQQFSLNKSTDEETLETVDAKYATSWINNNLYFSNETFEEIACKLERWYNFEMQYKDESIRLLRFTGFADRDKPIDELLHMMEMTNDVHFSVRGNVITIKRK